MIKRISQFINKSEFINESSKLDTIISAGIAIIYDSKILLVHGTNMDDNQWTIPKGEINKNENIIDGAIREVFEETSLKINKDIIKKLKPKKIEYISSKGNNKILYYFEYKIKDLNEIGLNKTNIDKSKLQLDEVDKAEFIDFNKAKLKVDVRMRDMLNYIS